MGFIILLSVLIVLSIIIIIISYKKRLEILSFIGYSVIIISTLVLIILLLPPIMIWAYKNIINLMVLLFQVIWFYSCLIYMLSQNVLCMIVLWVLVLLHVRVNNMVVILLVAKYPAHKLNLLTNDYRVCVY